MPTDPSTVALVVAAGLLSGAFTALTGLIRRRAELHAFVLLVGARFVFAPIVAGFSPAANARGILWDAFAASIFLGAVAYYAIAARFSPRARGVVIPIRRSP